MAKPIPYDEDDAPEDEGRDMRKIVLYDDEALKLMQGWTGGQSDPLYAISSTGGWNYAWVFSDAISNIDRDLSRVKKLGRNKFQLGQGTFSKAEIDELRYIRDALQMTLDDPESVMVEEGRGSHVHAPRGIYGDMPSFSPGDYVLHFREDRNTWSVDRIGPGGTHTTIGPTKGYGTTEGVRGAIEQDAHVKGKRNATIHDAGGDELGAIKDGRVYWWPGSLARYPYRHHTDKAGVRAPRHVRDYEAVDNHDRHIAGPFKSYGDARQAAGTAGVVKFVPSRGKRASEMRSPSRSAHTPTPVRRRGRSR